MDKNKAEDVRHHYGLAVAIAQDGLRSLLIVNGGAGVALVTFAGAIAGHDSVVDVVKLGAGVVYFGMGALTAVLSYVTAYLSQRSYGNHLLALGENKSVEGESALWWHEIWTSATFVLAFLSLGFGAYGLYQSGRAVGIF